MDIKFELKGIKAVQDMLDPKRFKKVVTRTLNKTASQANTAMSRKVREVYNIKAKDLRTKIRVFRANDGKLFAVIRVQDKQGMPLLSFSARQTRKGITYKVKKASGNKRVDGAFIATMESGHKGVFERYGEKVKPSRGKYTARRFKRGPQQGEPILRQSIQELFRIDAVGMVDQHGIMAIEQVIKEKMDDIFNHELGWEMSKG